LQSRVVRILNAALAPSDSLEARTATDSRAAEATDFRLAGMARPLTILMARAVSHSAAFDRAAASRQELSSRLSVQDDSASSEGAVSGAATAHEVFLSSRRSLPD
jgi:hypothetical protein